METLAQLIRNTKRLSNATHTNKQGETVRTYGNIAKNADEVNIFDLKVKSNVKKGVETLVFAAKAHALTDGKHVFWDVSIELYPTQDHYNVYKLPDLETDCWVQCSCPYFLYFCEYANTKAGSSEIEYSNGAKPRVRNPRAIPYVCKHLYKASDKVVKAMQAWAKTKEKRFRFV